MDRPHFHNPEHGKQILPEVDYQDIFRDRLERAEAIPEEYREEYAENLEAMGIKSLKREIPALAFSIPKETDEFLSSNPYELWIVDPRNIEKWHQPHDEVMGNLAAYLKQDKYSLEDKISHNKLGGLLLQDEEDNLYLLVDEIRAGGLKTVGKEIESERDQHILDLLWKYKIKKVAARVGRTREEGDTVIRDTVAEVIIDQDLIGERREKMYYLHYAKERGMTISQYLRLKSRTSSAIKAGIPFKVEEIADEIIKDDEKHK